MMIAEPGVSQYYEDNTVIALTAGFVAQDFGFTARHIMISNDSSATIYYNFDGSENRVIKTGEVISHPCKIHKVYLKGTAGGEEYRLWAV